MSKITVFKRLNEIFKNKKTPFIDPKTGIIDLQYNQKLMKQDFYLYQRKETKSWYQKIKEFFKINKK